MLRILMLSGAIAAMPIALAAGAPAAAQGMGQQCQDTPAKKTRRSVFGGIMGGLADNVLGRVGVPSSIAGVSLPVGSLLSDAIINLLDCKEQQQAAKATDDAVRGGVGTEVAWKSESRPNVSGRSVVTAADSRPGGAQCLTVTDIVIVDGEETSVPKRMCRNASGGYAKV